MRSQTFALASESSTSTKHLRSLAHIKILCRYTDMHRADIGTRHTLHVKGAKLTVNPIQTLQSHLSNKRSRLPPIQVARPEIQQTSKTSAPSRREGRDAASKGRRQTQKQKRHSGQLRYVAAALVVQDTVMYSHYSMQISWRRNETCSLRQRELFVEAWSPPLKELWLKKLL